VNGGGGNDVGIRGAAVTALAVVWWGCGGQVGPLAPATVSQPSVDPPQEVFELPIRPELGGRKEAAQLWVEPVEPEQPTAPVVRFQPGFHQALRWSHRTGGLVTFRFKIPVARTGQRLRLGFVAGNGDAAIIRATVAKAAEGGKLAGQPMRVTFGGRSGVELTAQQRVVSDPVEFPVSALDELYVSFAGDGQFAASAIDAFPESLMAWHDVTWNGSMPADAVPRLKLTGLTTIDVEGPASEVFVAVGDSITEGFVTGTDDTRRAWPFLAGVGSGLPVVNGSVSGQGWWAAHEYAAGDVGVLEGITHCIVLVGTNDLAAHTSAELAARLELLFGRLGAWCEVWAGTLLPKERTTTGTLEVVNERRLALNEWLRTGAQVSRVVDFAPVLAAPGDVNAFAPGYGEDGIHPSVKGQKVMGEFAGQLLGGRRSHRP
jgi:lysophospholipase L1-like esterase